jgi:hypothetical protein
MVASRIKVYHPTRNMPTYNLRDAHFGYFLWHERMLEYFKFIYANKAHDNMTHIFQKCISHFVPWEEKTLELSQEKEVDQLTSDYLAITNRTAGK